MQYVTGEYAQLAQRLKNDPYVTGRMARRRLQRQAVQQLKIVIH